MSIGIAAGKPETGNDSREMLGRADAALYDAKTAGRDRVTAAAED